MLPLYLLTAAKNSPILVELKNGETLNGVLLNCDSWMNLTLKDVIQSSANGEEFLKLPEIYIKGMHIKYMRMPDEIMDHAKEQNLINMEQRNRTQKRRGGGSNFNSNRRGHGPNRNGGYNNQHNRRHNNQQQHSTSNGGKL